MVFLVVEKYELRYESYDCETTTILGIYTYEERAKEILKQELEREHNAGNTSASLSIVEIDIDVDIC